MSNVGTWIQRVAQDWLVLTQLTAHSATAMGIVSALQFGPHLLLLPITGKAADRLDRRQLLMTTQAFLGLLAIALGLLTIFHGISLSLLYVLALLHGCVSAFDSPARHTFVSELVGEEELPNAVALNSTSFNAGRLIGPAAAGLLINSVGTGWAFLINGASFAGVVISLRYLRVRDLHRQSEANRHDQSFREALRFVWSRPELRAVMLMLAFIGTFGLNFPIFISTMAVTQFNATADEFGLLSSTMAIGSIAGALLAATRERSGLRTLRYGALLFGISCLAAALAPTYLWFAVALVFAGVSVLTFTTASNTQAQLGSDPGIRGRVMAMRLGISLGSTLVGAPVVGWVADRFGARWAVALGAASGFVAAVIAAVEERK